MQRKIFIGVNLSNELKKRLMQKVSRFKDAPVRWSEGENLHLDLINLGHIEDEILYDVCDKVKKIVENVDVFDIDIDSIELLPAENPKKVVFIGKESEELKNLCEVIEKELNIFGSGKKSFRPSITLGRIQQFNWQKLENKPEIKENFTVLLPIESVEIFESVTEGRKRKFEVLESCELKI